MDEELLEKTKQFLYQLHYEDTGRESHYESRCKFESIGASIPELAVHLF